jgi:crossover junction endodeoxyribonuclease RuvC
VFLHARYGQAARAGPPVVSDSTARADRFLFVHKMLASYSIGDKVPDMAAAIRIIGIDPGLRCTGWGIVETQGNALTFVAAGTLKSDDKAPLAVRLCQLHDGLSEVVRSQQPAEAAVEETFVNKDAVATLKLGQARGIAMLVPALAGLPVAEYAPNTVKKAVIGVGHGDKRQIHVMVRVLMPRAVFDTEHAADALAIAICHAHHRQSIAWRLAAMAG